MIILCSRLKTSLSPKILPSLCAFSLILIYSSPFSSLASSQVLRLHPLLHFILSVSISSSLIYAS
jgi:hypothetical protein